MREVTHIVSVQHWLPAIEGTPDNKDLQASGIDLDGLRAFSLGAQGTCPRFAEQFQIGGFWLRD